MEALKQSIRLFEDLNGSGIRYCHWKSNEHLLEGLAGETDLDVLFDKSQAEETSEILKRNGYIRLESQYGSRYPDVEDWIGCDGETKGLIHIHLHYAIVTGHAGLKEYNLPWTEKALATRVMNETYPVYTSDPNLEIILLLTRIGLKATLSTRLRAAAGRYALSADDVREFRYLNERTEDEKVAAIARPYYGADTEKLLELARDGKYGPAWIRQLMTITGRHMKGCARYGTASLAVLKPWYRTVLFARRAFRKVFGIRMISRKTLPAGSDVSVALIGQDGAGKSTVLRDLTKWLTWKMDVQTYYMGCGDGYQSMVKKLMNFCSGRKALRPAASLLSVIHYVQVARHVRKNFRSTRKYAAAGSIVLFDRYPQTKYAGINDGPKIREIAEKRRLPSFAGSLARKAAAYEEKCYALADEFIPSAVIKLVLPPEVSIARKPNEAIEDVRKKHEIILSLPFPGSEVLTVDATMDYDEEIRTIRGTVWKKIDEAAGR